MLVASWNVNSITVRLETVLKWVDCVKPDVLCLQETKIVNDKFPTHAFQQLGYQSEFTGQPTYNGVAILAKMPLMNIEKHIEAGGEDSPIGGTIGSAPLGEIWVIELIIYGQLSPWLNPVPKL